MGEGAVGVQGVQSKTLAESTANFRIQADRKGKRGSGHEDKEGEAGLYWVEGLHHRTMPMNCATVTAITISKIA